MMNRNLNATVCYVAAFPIAQVIRGINAFTAGCRFANPDCMVSILRNFFFLCLFVYFFCLHWIYI